VLIGTQEVALSGIKVGEPDLGYPSRGRIKNL